MNKRMKKVWLVMLACLAVGFVFIAGGCDKAQKIASAGGIAEEKLFDYRQSELDNGLQVITLEDFSCPIVAVQVWYHVGSKNEQSDRQGFAHMFEHMMFKGTDRVDAKDHFNFISRVGGTNNAYTSFDVTVYHEVVPADQLELAFWLEAERMAFLKIDQDSFDTERKVVEEELRMGENRPYGRLSKKEFDQMFKVHPYNWTPIGKLEHLRVASVPELRDFWTRFYVPNNATLVIAGAIEHSEARKLADKYFGWIPKCPDSKRVEVREPERTSAQRMVINDENAPVPLVEIIWRTVPRGHSDEVVLDLLSEVLGGGNSSRLYRKLVAQELLAVSAEAQTYNLEHDGMFFAKAVKAMGVDLENVEKALKEEVEKIKAEPVTEEELQKARNQMLKAMVTQNLTVKSKAGMLGNAATVMGETERVNTVLDEIRAVTKEDLYRAANQYLGAEQALTVIVNENARGTFSSEDVPVTGVREEVAPEPGRKGVVRGKGFPAKAPFGKLIDSSPMPKYSETVLENGLKVMVVSNHEVPFVSVKLGLMAGAWTEEKPGTASMAMAMLTKGTAKHSEGALAAELERYAISLAGSAEMDTSDVSANCLAEHVERAMKLMAEVVFEPKFAQDEFEKLREQVVAGLKIKVEKPRYLAGREVRRRLYGGHPYARDAQGQLSDVEVLEPGDLKAWWQKAARPDTTVLIFAGDIEAERAEAIAAKVFGKWEKHGQKQEVLPAEFPTPKDTHIYIVDRPGSMQSEIRIAQLGITRHNQPGYFISRIVSNYFGWSFNSWLNESIRVKKGLTYSVWGSYTAHKFGGTFEVGTFSKNETTAETVRAALDEIRRLQSQEPADEELADSKSFILGSFVRNREAPQKIAEDLWLIESQNLGADYLDRLLESVAQTSKADCLELTSKTIDPDKMIVVVVGDASKIAGDLEKIAPVTIVKN